MEDFIRLQSKRLRDALTVSPPPPARPPRCAPPGCRWARPEGWLAAPPRGRRLRCTLRQRRPVRRQTARVGSHARGVAAVRSGALCAQAKVEAAIEILEGEGEAAIEKLRAEAEERPEAAAEEVAAA